MIVCYYPNTLEGCAAAAVVHQAIQDMEFETDIHQYLDCADYTDCNRHTLSDSIVIVGIPFGSSDLEEFIKICDSAKSVIWIDRSQASIDMVEAHYKELNDIDNMTFVVDGNMSVPCLAFGFFKASNSDPKSMLAVRNAEALYYINAEIELQNIIVYAKASKNDEIVAEYNTSYYIPRTLRHIDEYFTHNIKDSNTMPYIYGIISVGSALKTDEYTFNPIYKFYNDDTYNSLVSGGKFVAKYLQTLSVNSAAEGFYVDTKSGGTCFCKNSMGGIEEVDHILPTCTGAILYYYSGDAKKWKYRFYSQFRECSTKVCKAFKSSSFADDGSVVFSTDMNIINRSDTAEKSIFDVI